MSIQIPPGLDRCQILEIFRLNGAAWATPDSSVNTMVDAAVFTDGNGMAQMRGFQNETADGLRNGSLMHESNVPGDYASLRIGPNKKTDGATVNSAIHLRANGDIPVYGGDATYAEFGGFTISRMAGLNNWVNYTLWANPNNHASALHRFVVQDLATSTENLILMLSGSAITFYKAQTTVSDTSTKYNISPLDDLESFDKVMSINPISFVRNGNPSTDIELGFSANELNGIEANVAKPVNDGSGMGIYTVDIGGVLAMLVGAVKHLSARVAALEAV